MTDRNGAPEIWLHKPGQQERPLVTARDFPHTTQWIMGPSLSPDATRVIYARNERNGPAQLWLSAAAGGAPVRLMKASADIDFAGSWSPDRNSRLGVQKLRSAGPPHPSTWPTMLVDNGP